MRFGNNLFFSAVVIVLISFISCSPAPETTVSPSLGIELVQENGRDIYRFTFTAGIRNENDSTLFTDVSGEIVVSGENKKEIFRVPFSSAVILPFDTAIIEKVFTREAEEARPLLDAYEVDSDRLLREKKISGVFIDESRTRFEGLHLKRKNIVSYLKEVSAERN